MEYLWYVKSRTTVLQIGQLQPRAAEFFFIIIIILVKDPFILFELQSERQKRD